MTPIRMHLRSLRWNEFFVSGQIYLVASSHILAAKK